MCKIFAKLTKMTLERLGDVFLTSYNFKPVILRSSMILYLIFSLGQGTAGECFFHRLLLHWLIHFALSWRTKKQWGNLNQTNWTWTSWTIDASFSTGSLIKHLKNLKYAKVKSSFCKILKFQMSLRANRIDVVSQQREQWGCPTNDCIISTESSKKCQIFIL